MSRSAPLFVRKSFEQHVGYIKSGRRPALKAPPVFNAWRRVLWPLKDRFELVKEREELEEGIKVLFHLGAPFGGVLDSDGLRRMLHCLDPYVLDSEVEAMMTEAVSAQPELQRHEKPPVPQRLFSVDDLIKIVSTLMLISAASQRPPDSLEGTQAWENTVSSGRWDNTQGPANMLLATAPSLSAGQGGTWRGDGVRSARVLTMTKMMSNFMSRPRASSFESSVPATPHDIDNASSAGSSKKPTVAGNGKQTKSPGSKPATAGSGGGGSISIERRPYHKALTLTLANHRLPLMRCILDPHGVLEEEENKIMDKERKLNEAEEARHALLANSLYRMKKPDRDKYGRSLLPPKAGTKRADDLFDPSDPRQVDRKTLITGPGRGNVTAFLKARQHKEEVDKLRRAAAAERQQRAAAAEEEGGVMGEGGVRGEGGVMGEGAVMGEGGVVAKGAGAAVELGAAEVGGGDGGQEGEKGRMGELGEKGVGGEEAQAGAGEGGAEAGGTPKSAGTSDGCSSPASSVAKTSDGRTESRAGSKVGRERPGTGRDSEWSEGTEEFEALFDAGVAELQSLLEATSRDTSRPGGDSATFNVVEIQAKMHALNLSILRAESVISERSQVHGSMSLRGPRAREEGGKAGEGLLSVLPERVVEAIGDLLPDSEGRNEQAGGAFADA